MIAGRVRVGNAIRRLGSWLYGVADRVEGCEIIAVIPFALEPEHALTALRDAEFRRQGAQ